MANTAGTGNTATITVTGYDRYRRAANQMFQNINSPERRYEISQAGTPFVLNAYKNLTYPNKQGREVHYFYGQPVRRGNWQKSVQDLSVKRIRIRRTGVSIVGPMYRRAKTKTARGTTDNNAAANYAHMIFGSARAYEKQITMQAFNQAAPQALPAMAAAAAKITNSAAARAGLA